MNGIDSVGVNKSIDYMQKTQMEIKDKLNIAKNENSFSITLSDNVAATLSIFSQGNSLHILQKRHCVLYSRHVSYTFRILPILFPSKRSMRPDNLRRRTLRSSLISSIHRSFPILNLFSQTLLSLYRSCTSYLHNTVFTITIK